MDLFCSSLDAMTKCRDIICLIVGTSVEEIAPYKACGSNWSYLGRSLMWFRVLLFKSSYNHCLQNKIPDIIIMLLLIYWSLFFSSNDHRSDLGYYEYSIHILLDPWTIIRDLGSLLFIHSSNGHQRDLGCYFINIFNPQTIILYVILDIIILKRS